jgi:hypothetical protein
VRVRSVALAPQRLTVRLTLNRTARVHFTLMRGSHVAARPRPRYVKRGTHRMRVVLGRRLARGRYTLRLRATAGGRTVERRTGVKMR